MDFEASASSGLGMSCRVRSATTYGHVLEELGECNVSLAGFKDYEMWTASHEPTWLALHRHVLGLYEDEMLAKEFPR